MGLYTIQYTIYTTNFSCQAKYSLFIFSGLDQKREAEISDIISLSKQQRNEMGSSDPVTKESYLHATKRTSEKMSCIVSTTIV